MGIASPAHGEISRKPPIFLKVFHANSQDSFPIEYSAGGIDSLIFAAIGIFFLTKK
jgi:hypothetical protein